MFFNLFLNIRPEPCSAWRATWVARCHVHTHPYKEFWPNWNLCGQQSKVLPLQRRNNPGSHLFGPCVPTQSKVSQTDCSLVIILKSPPWQNVTVSPALTLIKVFRHGRCAKTYSNKNTIDAQQVAYAHQALSGTCFSLPPRNCRTTGRLRSVKTRSENVDGHCVSETRSGNNTQFSETGFTWST